MNIDIEKIGPIYDLKVNRDRMESIVWRCRNVSGGHLHIVLPAFKIDLPEGEFTWTEEAFEVEPGPEEQAILKRIEEQALASIADIDAALAELGVAVTAGEIQLRIPPVSGVPAEPPSGQPADAGQGPDQGAAAGAAGSEGPDAIGAGAIGAGAIGAGAADASGAPAPQEAAA